MKPFQYKCPCDLCSKWYPWRKRVMKKLTGKDRELFHEFCMKQSNEEEDLERAKAMLHGTWPGFKWLPKEIEKRGQRLEMHL